MPHELSASIFLSTFSIVLDDRLSAGDGYRRSGDIAGFIARKHHINRGKLLWLRRTFHRDLLAKVLYLLWRHGGRYQRGPNRTGGDRVGADAPFRKQLGKAPRKVLDGAFSSCIGKRCGLGLSALTDAVLMTELPGFMCGTAAFVM